MEHRSGCLAALTQLINGWLGYRVTGKKLTPRAAKIYEIAFVTVGLIGVALLGLISYRANRQERLHVSTQIGNTYTVSTPTGPKFVLPINKPLAFNLIYSIKGNGSARNVGGFARSSIQEDISDLGEENAVSDFEKHLKELPPYKSGIGANMSEGGTPAYITAYGPLLSPEDVTNLTSGRRVATVVGNIYFEDDFGRHVQHFCEVLVPPQDGGIQIWKYCDRYNDEQ